MKIKVNKPSEKSIVFKDSLHPSFWEGDVFNEEIRLKLLDIVESFIDELDIAGVSLDDITLTGSLANYNWNDKSDIDLHLIVDLKGANVDLDLLKDLFNLKRMVWNKRHNITLKGHDVEIYIQDKDETHHSTGVYSLQDKEWVKKPEQTEVELDLVGAQTKAQSVLDDINNLERFSTERQYEMAKSIQDKIKKMRAAGLESDGIYSPENIAFKILRNEGHIARLIDIKNNAYDEMFSMDEVYSQKQRAYMCAMAKPGADRPESLSQAEAEEQCSGPMKSEAKKKKKKKDDRCTRIAKRKYDVWPSAYASGAVVKCRQGKIWKGVKENLTEDEMILVQQIKDYLISEKTDYSKEKESGLHGWFSRQGGKGKSKGWVDCNTCRKDKKTGRKKCKPCGRKKGEKRSKYPACRPTPGACGTRGKGKKWGKKSKKTNEGADHIYKMFIDQELKPG